MTTSTVNGKPKADIAEIRKAAAVLFEPGQVVELRAPKAGRQRVISGYFDDWDKLAAAAADASLYAPGVYWTLNPVDPALAAG